MNRFFLYPILLLLALCVAWGCSGNDNASDEVELATDSIVQEGSFLKSNGEMCRMRSKVVITYPASYTDSTKVEQLQRLYNSEVLRAPKAIVDVKNALKYYAQSLVSSNTPMHSGATRASTDTIAGDDVDEIDIDQFESSVNISVVYNDNRIISFCKEETIKKNNQVTSVSHHYVNFDLDSVKRVTLNDLFRYDCFDRITTSLKQQLMSDKDASNEDELNDLGYFNLPNLTITGNFFFTPSGITWSYDPSVVAVASVGEPTIQLDYSDLKDFKCENSLLDRF